MRFREVSTLHNEDKQGTDWQILKFPQPTFYCNKISVLRMRNFT